MPIYEFHCGKCDQDSEILVRSTEWEGTKCPHCGSKKLTKKFSVFASGSGGDAEMGPGAACMNNPGRGGCGRCGTGVPHSH